MSQMLQPHQAIGLPAGKKHVVRIFCIEQSFSVADAPATPSEWSRNIAPDGTYASTVAVGHEEFAEAIRLGSVEPLLAATQVLNALESRLTWRIVGATDTELLVHVSNNLRGWLEDEDNREQYNESVPTAHHLTPEHLTQAGLPT
jgi:hypothetical protein